MKSLLTEIKTRCYRSLFLSENESRLEFIRRSHLARMLKYISTKVPYYQGLLRNVEIDSSNSIEVLSTLPVVSKSDLRNDPSRRSSFVGNDWKQWRNTGGSTGEPFRFPVGGNSSFTPDRESLCQAWLYKKITGKFEPKIISVDGSRVEPVDCQKNIFWTTRRPSFPYGSIHLSTLHLSRDTFPNYASKLEEELPEVLRGYPSGIAELARFAIETDYHFRIRPKGIYLTSENIRNEQLDLIEGVFKCPVWGQYGHTENSVFGIRRPGTEYYDCHPIVGVTEVLRPDGSHVNFGETGEVVVTGFSNYAQPFIRYRTGDLAEYGGQIGGYTRLSKLFGRDTDFITGFDGRKHYLVGLVFGGHIDAFNHISGWQIEETCPGSITLNIIRRESYNDSVRHELINLFEKEGFNVKIEYVESLIKNARGKQPFLIKRYK